MAFWRKPQADPEVPVICIVTPVFNGAAFIDETIHSVLGQAGDFVLHYHVQDGGSTDDTMKRVRHWMKLAKALPAVCRRRVFTCSSERDTGMYDALNRGFARALPPGDDVVMGWIGADDRVAPGACAALVGIRSQFPDVRFLGGRISLLDEPGSIIHVHQIFPFSRRCMAAGLYDGRALRFVMQEGTFWCADLWRKVGGLDTRFRLAGDWDLWRRMAVHEPYISANSIFGFHRRRSGQLSEQMDAYYREVDEALDALDVAELPEILALRGGAAPSSSAPLRAAYDAITEEYEAITKDYDARKADAFRFKASAHATTVVRFNLPQKLWERTHGFGDVPVAPELVTVAGATASRAIMLKDESRAWEGPDPEFGLPSPARRMTGALAEGEVSLPQPGLYRLVIRDGSHELITGFAEEEGPYLDLALPNSFNWALGVRNEVRIFSAFAGRRVVKVKIRNARGNQRLTIKTNEANMLSTTVEEVELTVLTTISFEADFDVGFNAMTFESTQQASSEDDPRLMAFIFEDLQLGPLQTS